MASTDILARFAEISDIFLLSVPSRHRVVLRIDAGETFPLHATALGKVLLASAGNERARKLLGKGTTAEGDRTYDRRPEQDLAAYTCDPQKRLCDRS